MSLPLLTCPPMVETECLCATPVPQSVLATTHGIVALSRFGAGRGFVWGAIRMGGGGFGNQAERGIYDIAGTADWLFSASDDGTGIANTKARYELQLHRIETGELVWNQRTDRPPGTVLGGNDSFVWKDDIVHVLDVSDLGTITERRLTTTSGGELSALVDIDGAGFAAVYVHENDGAGERVARMRAAGDSLVEEWTIPVDGLSAVIATPTRIVVSDAGGVRTVNNHGQKLWADPRVASQIAVSNDGITFAASSDGAWALDQSGAQLWKVSAESNGDDVRTVALVGHMPTLDVMGHGPDGEWVRGLDPATGADRCGMRPLVDLW